MSGMRKQAIVAMGTIFLLMALPTVEAQKPGVGPIRDKIEFAQRVVEYGFGDLLKPCDGQIDQYLCCEPAGITGEAAPTYLNILVLNIDNDLRSGTVGLARSSWVVGGLAVWYDICRYSFP
ncbi:MAG: hypothetical protein ACPGQL_07035 [Thermoplasmatota archaeon]